MERKEISMEILRVEKLCKVYGTGEARVDALKEVSFSLEKGEFAAVIGESGSGKSTLLNCIGGLDEPTSGKVWLDGENLFSLSEKKRTIFRRQNIGFIFQSFHLIQELDVEQNIVFPLLLDHRKPEPGQVEEMLQVLGLTDRRRHLPGQLSGGQQQRVAIARALITRPEILLMDEPLCNLDVQLRVEMRTEMAFLFRRLGTTVFHVTHDPSEAFAMADRIVIMNKGNIDQIDTPQNCYRNPKTESVAALLGAGNAVHGTASADGAEAVRLGGVSCMAAGREGICREDPVSIRFRAENAVWRGDQNEGNGFPVTVEYSSFEGDFYRVMAKTVEGEPLCFLSREFLKKGVRGYVAVEKSRLYVYGRECA